MNAVQDNISSVYNSLRVHSPSVKWANLVWHRLSAPKTRFIFWLAMLNKLKTREKLKHAGIIDEDSCPFCCNDSESVMHLFFSCHYSQQCFFQLTSWIGVNIKYDNIFSMNPRQWKVLRFKRKNILVSVCSLIYMIWKTRNDCVWNLKLMSVPKLISDVKFLVKHRMQSLYTLSVGMLD